MYEDADTTEFLGLPTPTPEGLQVVELPMPGGRFLIREVGKLDCAIHEYVIHVEGASEPYEPGFAMELGGTIEGGGLMFIVQKLAEIEERCRTLAKQSPLPIELLKALKAWRWNQKAAGRRLRRWIRENDLEELEVPSEFAEVVRRAIKSAPRDAWAPEQEPLIDRIGQGQYEREIESYERRKQDRVFIIVPELPTEFRFLLREAREAYYWGLFRAAVALCRAILEDALLRTVDLQPPNSGPIPFRKDSLGALIGSVPRSVWSERARALAVKIRDMGNEVLHNPEANVSEDDAWFSLARTRKIVELLATRGCLRAR